MRKTYLPEQLDELSDHERLYGEIAPAGADPLPAEMHAAGLKALEIDAPFVRIEVAPDQLPDCLKRLRQLPFAGWTAAPRFHRELCDFMDRLGESAESLRGVNTVVCDEGEWIGFNTFGEAWVRAVKEEFYLDVRDLKVLVIGTEGIGAALARQAALEGSERLVLTDPHSRETAQSLAEELRDRFISEKLLGAHDRLLAVPFQAADLTHELDATDLVVNATALGQKPTDPAVLGDRLIQPHLCVMDMICRSTRLQESARKAGARATDGSVTCLNQSLLSLELWTGRSTSAQKIRAALQK